MLGVDFGFKRIGLAVGESEVGVINSRPAMDASGALKADALAISQFARREEADGIVLGLPIEETGTEGRMARICRTLGGHLSERGEKVFFVNEIYSSLEAENVLIEAGIKVSKRKELRDGQAASVILERFFDGQISP